MAKSIRSKFKRKNRAIKRKKYAVYEKERLIKTLGIGESEEMKEVPERGNDDENGRQTSGILETTRRNVEKLNSTVENPKSDDVDRPTPMETNSEPKRRTKWITASQRKKEKRKNKRLGLKKGQTKPKWIPQKH